MNQAFMDGLFSEYKKLAAAGELNPLSIRRLLSILAKAGLFSGAALTGYKGLKFYSDVIDHMTTFPVPEERRLR